MTLYAIIGPRPAEPGATPDSETRRIQADDRAALDAQIPDGWRALAVSPWPI